MQVENKEINGFLIDKFNQYNLEVGKTQGVCPWSTECRKPSNHKKHIFSSCSQVSYRENTEDKSPVFYPLQDYVD